MILRSLLSFALALLLCATAAAQTFLDPEAARQWCDQATLDRVEGIWEYPEDKVTVLIRKPAAASGTEPHDYEIVALDSPGYTVEPGMTIGWLERTTDPLKFKMHLYTKRKKGKLSKPKKCAATLVNEDCGMTVTASRLSFTFNPLGLLPYFWKLVRVRQTDPTKSLPAGMLKVYPSYDGNGSSRYSIRYL